MLLQFKLLSQGSILTMHAGYFLIEQRFVVDFFSFFDCYLLNVLQIPFFFLISKPKLFLVFHYFSLIDLFFLFHLLNDILLLLLELKYHMLILSLVLADDLF
jgi:hypothetical protein